MPITSAQFQLADQVASGELEATIRRYRSLGCSWPAVANILQDTFSLDLNPETLRRWGNELGADKGAAA